MQGIPEGSRAAKPHGFLRPAEVTEEKISKIKQLDQLARARGQSLAQFALAWVLRHPQMTSVLIGASSIAQIEENIKACDNLQFSTEELKTIDAIVPAAHAKV